MVHDNGRGFGPLSQAHTPPHSVGLTGMRERIAGVHGSVDVRSGPASGATVTVRVPVPS